MLDVLYARCFVESVWAAPSLIYLNGSFKHTSYEHDPNSMHRIATDLKPFLTKYSSK